jgi:hypothetical protein
VSANLRGTRLLRSVIFRPLLSAVALWTLTAQPAAAGCAGDCDGDGQVAVNELVTGVGIALGGQPLAACPSVDGDGDGTAGIAELVAAVNGALLGCPPEPTPTMPVPTAPTATPTPTPAASQDPPAGDGPLRAWLEAGNYLDWAAESAPHPSTGPHFGTVRVFVNNRLFDSLQQGLVSHPAGAATVKELYGRGGSAVMGWSVMVKVEDDSAGGQGWYWYERFNTSLFADGRGVGGCSGCHAIGRDFIRIPFPLQ